MFTGFLVRDDNDKLRDLATRHPFVQLRHNLLDVGFDLVVGGNYDRSTRGLGYQNRDDQPSILRPYFLTL